jgi:hypothetical protein
MPPLFFLFLFGQTAAKRQHSPPAMTVADAEPSDLAAAPPPAPAEPAAQPTARPAAADAAGDAAAADPAAAHTTQQQAPAAATTPMAYPTTPADAPLSKNQQKKVRRYEAKKVSRSFFVPLRASFFVFSLSRHKHSQARTLTQKNTPSPPGPPHRLESRGQGQQGGSDGRPPRGRVRPY